MPIQNPEVQFELFFVDPQGNTKLLHTTPWERVSALGMKSARRICEAIGELNHLRMPGEDGVSIYFPGSLLKSCYLLLREREYEPS